MDTATINTSVKIKRLVSRLVTVRINNWRFWGVS